MVEQSIIVRAMWLMRVRKIFLYYTWPQYIFKILAIKITEQISMKLVEAFNIFTQIKL